MEEDSGELVPKPHGSCQRLIVSYKTNKQTKRGVIRHANPRRHRLETQRASPALDYLQPHVVSEHAGRTGFTVISVCQSPGLARDDMVYEPETWRSKASADHMDSACRYNPRSLNAALIYMYDIFMTTRMWQHLPHNLNDVMTDSPEKKKKKRLCDHAKLNGQGDLKGFQRTHPARTRMSAAFTHFWSASFPPACVKLCSDITCDITQDLRGGSLSPGKHQMWQEKLISLMAQK